MTLCSKNRLVWNYGQRGAFALQSLVSFIGFFLLYISCFFYQAAEGSSPKRITKKTKYPMFVYTQSAGYKQPQIQKLEMLRYLSAEITTTFEIPKKSSDEKSASDHKSRKKEVKDCTHSMYSDDFESFQQALKEFKSVHEAVDRVFDNKSARWRETLGTLGDYLCTAIENTALHEAALNDLTPLLLKVIRTGQVDNNSPLLNIFGSLYDKFAKVYQGLQQDLRELPEVTARERLRAVDLDVEEFYEGVQGNSWAKLRRCLQVINRDDWLQFLDDFNPSKYYVPNLQFMVTNEDLALVELDSLFDNTLLSSDQHVERGRYLRADRKTAEIFVKRLSDQGMISHVPTLVACGEEVYEMAIDASEQSICTYKKRTAKQFLSGVDEHPDLLSLCQKFSTVGMSMILMHPASGFGVSTFKISATNTSLYDYPTVDGIDWIQFGSQMGSLDIPSQVLAFPGQGHETLMRQIDRVMSNILLHNPFGYDAFDIKAITSRLQLDQAGQKVILDLPFLKGKVSGIRCQVAELDNFPKGQKSQCLMVHLIPEKRKYDSLVVVLPLTCARTVWSFEPNIDDKQRDQDVEEIIQLIFRYNTPPPVPAIQVSHDKSASLGASDSSNRDSGVVCSRTSLGSNGSSSTLGPTISTTIAHSMHHAQSVDCLSPKHKKGDLRVTHPILRSTKSSELGEIPEYCRSESPLLCFAGMIQGDTESAEQFFMSTFRMDDSQFDEMLKEARVLDESKGKTPKRKPSELKQNSMLKMGKQHRKCKFEDDNQGIDLSYRGIIKEEIHLFLKTILVDHSSLSPSGEPCQIYLHNQARQYVEKMFELLDIQDGSYMCAVAIGKYGNKRISQRLDELGTNVSPADSFETCYIRYVSKKSEMAAVIAELVPSRPTYKKLRDGLFFKVLGSR